MIRVYVDCNILIDWLLDREPYSYYAAKVIEYVERKKVDGYVSALTLANTYYIITKELNRKVGNEFLKDASKLFHFVGMSGKATRKAIERPHRDFEDALHYSIAIEHGMDYIITRNKKDFVESEEISLVDAEEFVRLAIGRIAG